MNALTLTLAIAIALILAVGLGWTLRWLFTRLAATGGEDGDGLHHLATRLQEAEEARRLAEEELHRVRAAQAGRIAALEAELEATMEGLGQARRDALDWRLAHEALTGRQ